MRCKYIYFTILWHLQFSEQHRFEHSLKDGEDIWAQSDMRTSQQCTTSLFLGLLYRPKWMFGYAAIQHITLAPIRRRFNGQEQFSHNPGSIVALSITSIKYSIKYSIS